jgi:hypothetical protein
MCNQQAYVMILGCLLVVSVTFNVVHLTNATSPVVAPSSSSREHRGVSKQFSGRTTNVVFFAVPGMTSSSGAKYPFNEGDPFDDEVNPVDGDDGFDDELLEPSACSTSPFFDQSEDHLGSRRAASGESHTLGDPRRNKTVIRKLKQIEIEELKLLFAIGDLYSPDQVFEDLPSYIYERWQEIYPIEEEPFFQAWTEEDPEDQQTQTSEQEEETVVQMERSRRQVVKEKDEWRQGKMKASFLVAFLRESKWTESKTRLEIVAESNLSRGRTSQTRRNSPHPSAPTPNSSRGT